MWVGSGRSTLCASANEELGTLADNNPLTVAAIAASELDSKLVKYLESLMTQGHDNSKGLKLSAAVLRVCLWMG